MVNKCHFWSKPRFETIVINKHQINFLLLLPSLSEVDCGGGGGGDLAKDFVFHTTCTSLAHSIIYEKLTFSIYLMFCRVGLNTFHFTFKNCSLFYTFSDDLLMIFNHIGQIAQYHK